MPALPIVMENRRERNAQPLRAGLILLLRAPFPPLGISPPALTPP